MSKRQPEIGPIISDAPLSQDLLPRFLNALEIYDPSNYHRLVGNYPFHGSDNFPKSEWWRLPASSELLAQLFEALNEIAPDGHYFGSHPDDGACFGWWACEDLS